VGKKRKAPATGNSITELSHRAKAVLWRQDTGERVTYNKWKARVTSLKSQGMSNNEAIVRASQEFPCLGIVLRDYDLSRWIPVKKEDAPAQTTDPHPPSAPKEDGGLVVDGHEQSYRDNLRWAIEAAGVYMRTKAQPEKCPNNAAYYLYTQAIEAPKDFMAKVGQIESKEDTEAKNKANIRKESRKSVDEINEYLDELDLDNEESDA